MRWDARARAPQTYRHVVVIMEENQSYDDIVGRSSAPYLNYLATACGLATNYRGVTHPSHPNYMAATGGIPTSAGSIDAPNIFRQVRRRAGSWRVYQEAMPHNCDRRSAYPYKAGHNPGISYAAIQSGCQLWDVGWAAFTRDVANHALPTYAFITPDQCHNMHASCTRGATAIRAGDTWLSHGSSRRSCRPPDTNAAARPSSSPGTRARTARAPPSTARTAWHART